MEFIINLFANWETILGVVAALHVIALAIVNLTPTQIDNEWLARVWRLVEAFAGLLSSAARNNTPLK